MAEEKIAKEIQKEEKKAVKELKSNPWIVATFVFVIIALFLLYFVLRGTGGAAVVSKDIIGSKAVSFINTQLLQGQGTVTLDSVSEKAGLYEVTVDYNGQKVPAYFTKDGGYYVGTTLLPMANLSSIMNSTAQTTPTEVPKSDKPTVELFVMSFCPYGTQAEKGIIPAVQSLGNSIDFNVRFVHYTMHGAKEDEENARQLCIREGQKSNYLDYLKCFLNSTSGSVAEANSCMSKTGVNALLVNQCMSGANNKSAQYYASDSALSKGYGVQGSPTLIINGVETNAFGSDRSSANALKVICAAFNTPPAACNTVLSTANPSTGFGYATTAAATGTGAGAACATA